MRLRVPFFVTELARHFRARCEQDAVILGAQPVSLERLILGRVADLSEDCCKPSTSVSPDADSSPGGVRAALAAALHEFDGQHAGAVRALQTSCERFRRSQSDLYALFSAHSLHRLTGDRAKTGRSGRGAAARRRGRPGALGPQQPPVAS
jgi:hypothetical protein